MTLCWDSNKMFNQRNVQFLKGLHMSHKCLPQLDHERLAVMHIRLYIRPFGPLYGFLSFIRIIIRICKNITWFGFIIPFKQAIICYDCLHCWLYMIMWATYGNLDLYTGFGALYGSVYGYMKSPSDCAWSHLSNKPSYATFASSYEEHCHLNP